MGGEGSEQDSVAAYFKVKIDSLYPLMDIFKDES